MPERWIFEAEAPVKEAVAAALELNARFEERDYRAALAIETVGDDGFKTELASVIAEIEAAPSAFDPLPDAAAGIRGIARDLAAGNPLDPDALRRIDKACAMFTRLHMGQWDIVLEGLAIGDLEQWSHLTHRFLGRRARNISTRGTTADVTSDVHQVVRRHLAYLRHPEGGWQNVFDPPLKSSPHKLATLRAETDRIATTAR